MTNADLMALVGKKVTILFKDGGKTTGILEYIPEFSSKYGFRKPNMFSIQDKFTGESWSFKVSHVKRVDYWFTHSDYDLPLVRPQKVEEYDERDIN